MNFKIQVCPLRNSKVISFDGSWIRHLDYFLCINSSLWDALLHGWVTENKKPIAEFLNYMQTPFMCPSSG